ncbi:hypothetical protein T459_34927 [Capsicum annuum]|uniref:Ubiquitin-like protease family profile domain-containing protein n=1 Tax=Capsicum annuum TaxID=4072 RepID=A0A2G2XUQ8_CAPAN|nr:hypothetical protein T459_34927 [Capsicum annuum]
MAQHAKGSFSVSANKSMDLVSDELPSFSLGLTQDEVSNFCSSNIQAKEGVSSEGGSLKHCNNLKNIVEKMKRKGLKKPSSPKPPKIQKSVKKTNQDEKGECSKISSPVSSDFESEEEKVEEDAILSMTLNIAFKSTLTKNQYNIFCNNSIFVVFMKKKNFVVQAQFERCIMSLETKESTANAIVIRAKGTNLHFNPREFAVVTGLNCVSNKDDFVFDEDLLNRLIEDYFGGAKYIQKRELFAAFSGKLWGKDNDEDAVKFANLYFIHAFLLSVVDTAVIPRLHFDLVESGRYSDYPWGSVAFEELAKSLNRKLKPKGKFYMLHGMSLAIQIWFSRDKDDFVSKKVFHKFRNEVLQEMKSIRGLVSTRCDAIMNAISEIKKIGVAAETTVNTTAEDESKNNKCDAEKIVDTPEVAAETTMNTSAEDESRDNEGAAEKILNSVESNMDNSKLNQQNQSPIHIHIALIEQRKDEQNFSDSQVTIPDELLPSLNVYFNQERKGERKIFYQKHPFVSHPVNDIEDTKVTNKFLKWLSMDILKFHAKRSNKQEHYKKGKSKISVISFGVLAVENKNWFYIMGTPGQSWSDEAKHHWVLTVISFNDRCIYVHDSLLSAGHDAGVLAEVEKLAKIDLFDIYVVEDLSQQPSGSLDCGLYMVTYAECLTFGDIVSPVDFDPDLIRTRYASILWN